MRLPKFPFLTSPSIFALGFLIALAGSAYAAAPVVSSFSPTSGTIGTAVAITGTGFTGATTVSFNGVAATFRFVNSTRIVATAPIALSTGKIAVRTAGGTGTSKTSFVVTPGSQLSVTFGPPFSNILVSGAGSRPSTAVDIYFDTDDRALAITSPQGLISMQMQIPATAQPGFHWISLVARGTYTAAQSQFKVNVNWPMVGFAAPGRGINTFENTIGTGNVASLSDLWTKTVNAFVNRSPLVELNGNVYVGDVDGGVHAFSNTGTLLWTAATGSDLQNVTPVAFQGQVFFGAANGNVYAYLANCRTDGGVCTPKWTKSVGTAVTSSLKIYQGQLYAPSSDGSIHVFNPQTGAEGTAVSGFDTTHGAVTTPITFDGAGTFYYGVGTAYEYRTADGGSGYSTQAGTVSPFAAINNVAYYTTSDGNIHEFGGAGWSAATSGPGCAPAPVVAKNTVYAGGCTTLAAFEASRGSPRWSTTTAGPVLGLSVANGILYGCVGVGVGFGGVVVAYDASYGGLLWSGGSCSGDAPIVANGMVFAAFGKLTAYSLPNFQPATVPSRPASRALRPDFRLLPNKAKFVPVSAAE